MISVTQTDTLSPALCPALVFTCYVGQRDLISGVDGPHSQPASDSSVVIDCG